MSKFTIRELGMMTDDETVEDYYGVALEGDIDAIRAVGKLFGQPVAIVPADLLDEAEKALAGLIYEATHMSPEYDDGSHDARISKSALTAARTTRARIRGEKT